MADEPTRWARLATPVGPLLVAGGDSGLRRIAFAAGRRVVAPAPDWIEDAAALAEPARQLAAWFAGELRRFELELDPGGTTFQRAAWRAVAAIPYGETATYSAIALIAGSPKASRAVGAANGANPLPIVVPCHRVIGADGSLTGFAGGVQAKRLLLAHEARRAGADGTAAAVRGGSAGGSPAHAGIDPARSSSRSARSLKPAPCMDLGLADRPSIHGRVRSLCCGVVFPVECTGDRPMPVTSVRLDDDLHSRLDSLAKREQRTRGWLINDALRDYLEQEELRAERYRQSLEALEEIEAGAPTVDGAAVHEWIASWGTEAETPVPHIGGK